MDGIVAYILSKKFTKDTVIGMGAIKGAACQVQSINKVGKTTTITLKWEDNTGTVHTQNFDIEDGVDVTNAEITSNGHLSITLSDGTVIDCGKVLPQYDTMPTPSATYGGAIFQYIGNTTSTYTKGYFYECINDGGVYKWVEKSVQDSYTKGQIGSLSDLPDTSKNVIENIANIKLSVDQLSASKLSISDIDNTLSNVSENPVQNKVIKLTLDQLRGSILNKLDEKEDKFRYSTMPTANVDYLNKIVEYIGTTDSTYTNGYFYQCRFDGTNYSWVQKNVQPSSGGTGGDGVVDGYYNSTDQLFYEDSAFLNPITGENNTIYIDLNTNGLYRYNGVVFIKVSSSAESIQVDTMPTADNTQLNKIYQYVGATDTNYINGYFYKCVFDGVNYQWQAILTQDSYTKAEIGALSDLPDTNKNVIENIGILQGSVLNIKNDITNLQGSLAGIDKNKLNRLEPIYLIGSGLNLDSVTGRLTATGMSIPIDNHLDDTSINPVQNKVIALTIDQMQGSILEKIQKKLAATADDFVIFTNDGDIADSGISKDVVPSTVSISNKLLVASDLSVKADKVSGATDNDIALLDNTGNLKDSNKKLSDYQEKLTDGNGVVIDASNNIGLDISYLTASRVGYIPATEKGAHSGVAELDTTGKVPSSQLPSYVDDVIDGYYKEVDGKFYEDSAYTTEIVGESGKIYISLDTDIQYRWTGTAFAALGGALQLGETASTAYRGDRGKIAYDHSQITDGSNPHHTTANNVNLKVPISALSGSKLDVESTLYGINTELGKRADKVSSATNGDLAGLDANGNLTDSGILTSNVIVKSNTVGLIKNDGSIDTTNYASKVASATADDFATLNASGNLVDSGINKNIIPSGASSSNKLATVNDIPNELNDLSNDVVITNPVNAQILAYNSTSQKWENQTGQAAIGGAVFKGSILFANLPTTGMLNGDWYDIKDAFTTDNRFEEGAGISCAAGTDIIWVNDDSKWNILTPSGVYSFNGRTGAVSPASGDYSKSDVGLGNVVNTGDSDTPVSGGTTKFTTGGAYTELNKKADKVANATNGNFAGLDANGNLTDSGKKASDFATDNQTFSQASTRTNIASGESFSTIFGKIMKWFADLKDLAFIDKPSSGQTTTFLRGDGTWVAPSGSSSWDTPINLSEGQTYQDFTGLSSSYAYEVWFDCANNVAPPTLSSFIFTSSTAATATFSAVTSAQTGTGNECKIRLRVISLS